MEVPVTVVGEARGVKEMGGILEHGTRELNIMCFPRNIPDKIEIDVSDLAIHESIRLRAIQGEHPDVEFLDDLDTTLAHVVPPKVEVEPVALEEEEAEEPEVIAKGKEEKAGEEAGDGEKGPKKEDKS